MGLVLSVLALKMYGVVNNVRLGRERGVRSERTQGVNIRAECFCICRCTMDLSIKGAPTNAVGFISWEFQRSWAGMRNNAAIIIK